MIVPVLPGCAAGPRRSSACACSWWRTFLSWPGRWCGGVVRVRQRMPRGARCWSPSPSSAQWPPGGGGLGCHDLVDGIGRPAAGLAAAGPRDRAGGGRGGRGRCVRRWFRLPVHTGWSRHFGRSWFRGRDPRHRGVRAAGRGHRCGDPHRGDGAGHDDAGAVAAAGLQRPAVPGGDAARAAAMGRGGAAADAGGGTAAARPDRNYAAGGHHLGLAATFSAAVIPVLVLAAWIVGGRVGGATLVPLGTTALGKRDRLEG